MRKTAGAAGIEGIAADETAVDEKTSKRRCAIVVAGAGAGSAAGGGVDLLSGIMARASIGSRSDVG